MTKKRDEKNTIKFSEWLFILSIFKAVNLLINWLNNNYNYDKEKRIS